MPNPLATIITRPAKMIARAKTVLSPRVLPPVEHYERLLQKLPKDLVPLLWGKSASRKTPIAGPSFADLAGMSQYQVVKPIPDLDAMDPFEAFTDQLWEHPNADYALGRALQLDYLNNPRRYEALGEPGVLNPMRIRTADPGELGRELYAAGAGNDGSLAMDLTYDLIQEHFLRHGLSQNPQYMAQFRLPVFQEGDPDWRGMQRISQHPKYQELAVKYPEELPKLPRSIWKSGLVTPDSQAHWLDTNLLGHVRGSGDENQFFVDEVQSDLRESYDNLRSNLRWEKRAEQLSAAPISEMDKWQMFDEYMKAQGSKDTQYNHDRKRERWLSEDILRPVDTWTVNTPHPALLKLIEKYNLPPPQLDLPRPHPSLSRAPHALTALGALRALSQRPAAQGRGFRFNLPTAESVGSVRDPKHMEWLPDIYDDELVQELIRPLEAQYGIKARPNRYTGDRPGETLEWRALDFTPEMVRSLARDPLPHWARGGFVRGQ